MPSLQIWSPWEQTYTKQLVKTFSRHKKNNAMIIIDAIKCLTRLKWVLLLLKLILKNQRRMNRKGRSFHWHGLANSHFIRFKIIIFCSLLSIMRTPILVQSANNHMIMKIRFSKFNGQADTYRRKDWQLLPNEIIQMILFDVRNSFKNSTETYAILSQTRFRFNDILK